jgi:hypothetical protein
MYHSFERIINDSMMVDDNGNEWIVNDDDGWYDDTWIDADTDYPEDMQGEEDFA